MASLPLRMAAAAAVELEEVAAGADKETVGSVGRGLAGGRGGRSGGGGQEQVGPPFRHELEK